jgi:hypothetical protein
MLKRIGGGLVVVLVLSGGARAQDGRLITQPEEVARCLCDQRRAETLQARAEQARHEYDEANARLEALNRRLAESRDRIDTNDPEQVDAYRRLLRDQETASARLFNDILPHTQAVARLYNDHLSRYGERCGGRLFDPAALAEARSTLACEADPP